MTWLPCHDTRWFRVWYTIILFNALFRFANYQHSSHLSRSSHQSFGKYTGRTVLTSSATCFFRCYAPNLSKAEAGVFPYWLFLRWNTCFVNLGGERNNLCSNWKLFRVLPTPWNKVIIENNRTHERKRTQKWTKYLHFEIFSCTFVWQLTDQTSLNYISTHYIFHIFTFSRYTIRFFFKVSIPYHLTSFIQYPFLTTMQ